MFNALLPKVGIKIPRLKMREAQEIILQRTGRDNTKEPDLTPEDEREICQLAKEKYGSEFIFITHYPTKKRPFYTYPDPENPDYTLSFDLLFRGLEIVTGGQRIHQYEKLLKNIKKFGLTQKTFKFYLQAFKYGLPPEGGFCLGGERMVKQILGLENVKEAGLFPRDMERIDQRLSLTQKKSKKGRKNV
jgi:nondiscriminating aspartyl-tRNA synthetase